MSDESVVGGGRAGGVVGGDGASRAGGRGVDQGEAGEVEVVVGCYVAEAVVGGEVVEV